jgi:hypothetical protein
MNFSTSGPLQAANKITKQNSHADKARPSCAYMPGR